MRVFITGATGHMGEAVALACARAGRRWGTRALGSGGRAPSALEDMTALQRVGSMMKDGEIYLPESTAGPQAR